MNQLILKPPKRDDNKKAEGILESKCWRPGRDLNPGQAGDSRLYWAGLYYQGFLEGPGYLLMFGKDLNFIYFWPPFFRKRKGR